MTVAPVLSQAEARAYVVQMMKDECESLGLMWYEVYGEILYSGAKEVAIFGGVRGSKSNVTALKVWLHPRMGKGGGLFWIVGGTYKAAEKEASYIYSWAMKRGWVKSATMPDRDSWKIVLRNGTVIETRSGEHPERLASDAPDLILVVEAGKVKPGVRKACQQRALEKDAQIYYSGTFEEEEDDTSQKYLWFEELDQEFQPEKDGWQRDFEKFSLPSWTNLFIFPGGFENPKIQWAKEHNDEYTFNRKYAGIPGEVQHAIYSHIQHNDTRLRPLPEHLKRPEAWITHVGGSDWGTVHPTALVVLGLSIDKVQMPGDWKGWWTEQHVAWVRECSWDGDRSQASGERGDTDWLASEKRRLQRSYPKLGLWVTDPNQTYMARSWNEKKKRFDPEAGVMSVAANMGAGSREVRIGALRSRHANWTLFYDLNGPGVERLYREQQRVRYRVMPNGSLEPSRIDDDQTAALEDANAGLSKRGVRIPRTMSYA